MLLHSVDTRASTMFMILITVFGLCIFAVGIYTFALLSRFENTVGGTLLNALRLALGHILRTLGMLAVWAAWAVFLWYIHGIALLVFVLYGMSLPGFLCTMVYDPVFRTIETNEASTAEQRE